MSIKNILVFTTFKAKNNGETVSSHFCFWFSSSYAHLWNICIAIFPRVNNPNMVQHTKQFFPDQLLIAIQTTATQPQMISNYFKP